jgi:putative ABC transport system permease protein
MNIFKQAWRMLWRDWRAGEIGFLLAAIVIAVSALSAVSFFAERIRNGLQRDAHQLLAADLLVSSDHPMPPAWRARAAQQGLQLADTVTFPSMAFNAAGAAKLVSLKAVGPGYPLRGNLKITRQNGAQGENTHATPAAGTVWVDANLLTALDLALGQSLQIGELKLQITQLIVNEPDRGASFMNFAPRVMMAVSDLPASGLIQPGSRVTWRLLVADQGPALSEGSAGLRQFRSWLKQQIEKDDLRGVGIEALDSSRPEMRMTLDRAERFLSLVGLLSSMLAAVAIALAARRFMLRHLNACVMLRFLGLTQTQASCIFLIEFVLLGLVGSALGALLGFAAHFALLQWLGKLLTTELPAATILPAGQAFVTGLVLLLGFALPPLLQLHNVTLNRILRHEADPPQAMTLVAYVLGALGFIALMVWQAGEVKLGLLVAAGFFLGLLAFALVAWLLLRALRQLRFSSRQVAWRFAFNSLQRRPLATVVQIVALALGLMALLLLGVVRGELVGAWRDSTPPDAPNRFVINIQPDQRAPVEQKLVQAGVDKVKLYPMIRGRLIKVNGQATSAGRFALPQVKRMLEREFNLSTMLDLPPKNEVVQGKWYGDQNHDQAGQAEASVEKGLFDSLGLKLGDKLLFDIGGQQVESTVTSVRKLDWGSMQVNFYVIINPKAMAAMPQTLITAFHLPPGKEAVGDQLVQQFPNLTVVDTGQILRQVQAVLDQVIAAVEFLFLFTLVAGAMVLYAVLLGSQDERKREAGLLRALGATRTQLARAQRIEFLFIGALAGALAASGAVLTGWALARFVFEFPWHWQPQAWLIGIAVGAACAVFGGWLGLRGVLSQPPLQTLREAAQ